MNTYGQLSEDGFEYIINTPDTPRPWINYLTNGDYCALCSHIGGGFSYFKDHRYNSILRRGPHVQLEDMPARLWYIKDEETGEIWTANAQPIGKYDSFEARHGMGYTKVASSYSDINSNILYYVAPCMNAELSRFNITNNSGKARKLSVYSFAEYILGNVSLDHHESQIMALFNEAKPEEQGYVFRKTWWHPHNGWSEENGNWPYRVFVTTTKTPDTSLSDRNLFFGAFRSYLNPKALETENLPEEIPSGKDLVSVFQWHIELQPGEQWSVEQGIGIQEDKENAQNRMMMKNLSDPLTYDLAWKELENSWEKLSSELMIQTPDEEINAMVNCWNKIQVMANFHFGRGPSYYHKGQYPAMRDSCQDTFGVTPLSPEMARDKILRIASFFFSDGRAAGGCNRMELPEGPSLKVDLPLWMILTVADYIRQTADWSVLDESLPLMDEGESTVLEKMIAGIDRMLNEQGIHGLPLIGHGDWNDAANAIGAGGKGESVWLAQFLYFVINEITPILKHKNLTEKVAAYRERAKELKTSVNENCWDGEWFVRAFKDNGSPVGVKGQKEGYIWINSQTWAAISGISTPERLNSCMDAVEEHMGSEHGLTNLAPAFTKVDEEIGLITRFRAGWKENAATFSHASSFNVVGRAMLGRGADAVDLFKRLLPLHKDADQYMMEPYVYSQFCAGPSTPEHGRGAYHWLTGTAAWMLRAMSDYICGVHPEFDGLRIAPAVDPSWKEFSIKRTFRGAEYTVNFSNPNSVESGVKELYLDGEKMEGTLLPPPTKDKHTIEVVMG